MSYKDTFLSQCLIIDTETTSDDYNTASIIELGFAIFTGNDPLIPSWHYQQYLHKPNQLIPPFVESICYITNQMVEDKPRFIDETYFLPIAEQFRNGYLIAHNYFYDMKVLQNHNVDLSKYQWIDTLRLVKKLYHEDPALVNLKLPYLRFHFKLDVPITMACHRAGHDCFITGKFLEHLVNVLEERNIIEKNLPYGPQIYEWAAKPIIYTKMPIGKHKDMPLDDVPMSYIRWALANMDSLNENADNYDSDFADSIVLSMERRGVI